MDARRWIEDYGAAWRGGDVAALERLFTEDAVYRSHPFRPPAEGIEAIRDYWLGATSTQAELDLRFGVPIVEGAFAAVEWWAQILDAGEEITLPGCLLLRFAADGRCEELREYWHLEEGWREPPDGWGR